MALVELNAKNKNYGRYLDNFLDALALLETIDGPAEKAGSHVDEVMVHDHAKPGDCKALNDGTRYRRISPQAVIRHVASSVKPPTKGGAGGEEIWKYFAATMGIACFNSPRFPAGLTMWKTCIARGHESGAMKVYQDAYSDDGIYSPDIIQIVGALEVPGASPDKRPPHITMIIGDVDGNGLEDVALFAANGAYRIYLSNDQLSGEEKFRKIDLFNSPTRLEPKPPPAKVPATTPPGTRAT